MDLYFLQIMGTNSWMLVAATNYEEARKAAARDTRSDVWLDRTLISCKRLTTEEDIRPLEIRLDNLS